MSTNRILVGAGLLLPTGLTVSYIAYRRARAEEEAVQHYKCNYVDSEAGYKFMRSDVELLTLFKKRASAELLVLDAQEKRLLQQLIPIQTAIVDARDKRKECETGLDRVRSELQRARNGRALWLQRYRTQLTNEAAQDLQARNNAAKQEYDKACAVHAIVVKQEADDKYERSVQRELALDASIESLLQKS